MEDHKREGTKSILLKASRMIMRLSQRSLDIIRERKMYHTKLIERSSKCTKDPNPLATTMILLNQKYPITLSAPEAKKYRIPRSLIAQTDKGRIDSDSHRHGRVLAKLSTIDWWIANSEAPNEQLRKLADILFSPHVEAVNEYYKIDWRHSRIKWGAPTLQRNLVRTNKPIVDIPMNLRNAAVKEVFFPDYTTPHPALPTGTVAQLREKMDIVLDDQLPLTKQIRIILNALDPKEKYLPILPASGESTVRLKHSLVHNNLVVVGYINELRDESNTWVSSFKNLVASIIWESKTSGIPIEEIKEICLSSSVSDVPFISLMENVRASDAMEFLWTRALFERPTTLEHTRGSMIVCPDPRRGREITIYNKKHIPRVIKMGNQVVNFKYLDLRGKFVYNGQTLLEVICN